MLVMCRHRRTLGVMKDMARGLGVLEYRSACNSSLVGGRDNFPSVCCLMVGISPSQTSKEPNKDV
jgi:hypothetical protein